jgi:hypothetical protein
VLLAELSKRKLASLDEDFQTYQHIKHDIAVRLVELDEPWRQSEENVGGGKSSFISRPQEEIVVRHDEDKSLQYLLNLEKNCKAAIKQMDDEQIMIYKLRYQSGNYYDWDTIGELLDPPVPHTPIYRKRYKLLELLAKEQGII